jgi:hypothetical protein
MVMLLLLLRHNYAMALHEEGSLQVSDQWERVLELEYFE